MDSTPSSLTKSMGRIHLSKDGVISANSLCSVYITDLPWQADECYLYHTFKRFGPIESVEVRRDPSTKVSLGNALITYEPGCQQDLVQRAIHEMNYTEMFGKTARVMRHMPDPEARKTFLNGGANLFVKNLAKEMTSKLLHSVFQPFGSILSCKVQVTHDGECKGYGYVSFETKEAADNAVKNMHGGLLNGRALYVTYFVPKMASKETRRRNCKLFIKHLDPSTDSTSLHTMARSFGSIRDAAVCTDCTGKTRCFGFVEFNDRESAEAAKQAMHNQPCGQGQLHVDFAQEKSSSSRYRTRGRSEALTWIKPLLPLSPQKNAPPPPPPPPGGSSFSVEIPGHKVLVGGMHPDVNDDSLRNGFIVCGEILASRVIRNHLGSSTGMGVIGFQESKHAKAATQQMDGTKWRDQVISVSLLPNSRFPMNGSHVPTIVAAKENRAVPLDSRRQPW